MSITAQVIPICQEILALPGLVRGPVLSWGVTAINVPGVFRKPWALMSPREKLIKLHHWMMHNLPWTLPAEFSHPDLGELLRSRGVDTIDVLDLYDTRANLRLDMNKPVDAKFYNRYALFVDIGCLEHVFDTRQCIENCLRMVAPGGHYVLCTPVSGWVGHGFHTFDPKGLGLALTLNEFEIVFQRYSSREGKVLARPKGDALMWLVGRKLREIGDFRIPQQDYWWGEMFGTSRAGQTETADPPPSEPPKVRALR